MAHFAELGVDNVVLRVIVVDNSILLDDQGNEVEQKGIDFCKSLLGGTWVQTSYNGRIRKNYAGQGYTYNTFYNAFIAPQPYPSWSLDEQTCQWVCPVNRPNDEKPYRWDEESLSWVEMQPPA